MSKNKGSEGTGNSNDRAEMIKRSTEGRKLKGGRRPAALLASGEKPVFPQTLDIEDLAQALPGALISVETEENGSAVFEVTNFSGKNGVTSLAIRLYSAKGFLTRLVDQFPNVVLPYWALTKRPGEFSSPMQGEAAEKQVEMFNFLADAITSDIKRAIQYRLDYEATVSIFDSSTEHEPEQPPQRWADASPITHQVFNNLNVVGSRIEVRFGNLTDPMGKNGFAAAMVAMPNLIKVYIGYADGTYRFEGAVFDDETFLQCYDGSIPSEEYVSNSGLPNNRKAAVLTILKLFDMLNANQRQMLEDGLKTAMERVKKSHESAQAEHVQARPVAQVMHLVPSSTTASKPEAKSGIYLPNSPQIC